MAQRVFELIIRYPLVASRVSFLHSEMLERDIAKIQPLAVSGVARTLRNYSLLNPRGNTRDFASSSTGERYLKKKKKMYAENIY